MSVMRARVESASDLDFTVSDFTVPSPAKIREMTAQIRKEWSPRERGRRAAIAPLFELLFVSVQSRCCQGA